MMFSADPKLTLLQIEVHPISLNIVGEITFGDSLAEIFFQKKSHYWTK